MCSQYVLHSGHAMADPISIRLPDALSKRANALAKKLVRVQSLQFLGKISRHRMLLMAIERGLSAMESELKQGRKRK